MSLSIGIVGLPNAGKSTLFNALVRGHQAKVADYPFTTIEPNVGIVEVPDERLALIAEHLSLSKIIPATIEFVDIAGLVKNAHKGEGLGNQFLSHIREVDAIVHVINAFSRLRRGYGEQDKEDKEIVNIELELADIKKPTIYVYNIKEEDIKIEKPGQKDTIFLCAKMEEELIDLSDNEAQEYLKSYGLKESGLDRLIKESYKLLNLITFYTIIPEKQIQAWPIKKDTSAPKAAGKVHTDFEKGFIKAEVTSAEKLIEIGSWQKARDEGLIRLEGKDYAVQDGDIIQFKHS